MIEQKSLPESAKIALEGLKQAGVSDEQFIRLFGFFQKVNEAIWGESGDAPVTSLSTLDALKIHEDHPSAQKLKTVFDSQDSQVFSLYVTQMKIDGVRRMLKRAYDAGQNPVHLQTRLDQEEKIFFEILDSLK